MVVLEHLHEFMHLGVEYVILAFEIVGILMLIYTGIKGLVNVSKKDPEVGLKLCEGMGMALQFLMGGEILRTVIVSDMDGILHVGGIVVLRVALTLLTHWELKNHREELHNEQIEEQIKEDMADGHLDHPIDFKEN